MKRAVGGKKNGAAKPPKKAKPGAQKPAAATKSRGPPWSGHPGWHCRRGRGLIDYIYTAPDGREFTDEASALRAFEGTGVDDSEEEEEEEEAPARRRHNAPAARQPAPAQAPAPTPASAPTAAAPGAKKSRRGEGAAAKPAKKPKPAAPKLHLQVPTSGRPNCIWCKRLHGQRSKTTIQCSFCREPLCAGKSSGRECWELHKVHGCPPVPKELKTAGARP